MVIGELVNKALEQVGFKIHCSGNGSGSGGGSSDKSNVTSHKCVKKGHIQKYYRSKRTRSSGNPPKQYEHELPEWVTKKPVVSNTRYLATSTTTRNKKKYKRFTSFNNSNVVLGFY